MIHQGICNAQRDIIFTPGKDEKLMKILAYIAEASRISYKTLENDVSDGFKIDQSEYGFKNIHAAAEDGLRILQGACKL